MKIATVTKESKRWMTVEQSEQIPALLERLKNDDGKIDLSYELEMLKNLFKGNKIFDISAEIAGNCRIWNYYTDSSMTLDVWICATIKAWGAIYEVGCYLSDLWSYAGDEDDIKSHMYIQTYKRI